MCPEGNNQIHSINPNRFKEYIVKCLEETEMSKFIANFLVNQSALFAEILIQSADCVPDVRLSIVEKLFPWLRSGRSLKKLSTSFRAFAPRGAACFNLGGSLSCF